LDKKISDDEPKEGIWACNLGLWNENERKFKNCNYVTDQIRNIIRHVEGKKHEKWNNRFKSKKSENKTSKFSSKETTNESTVLQIDTADPLALITTRIQKNKGIFQNWMLINPNSDDRTSKFGRYIFRT
jgi:hypothetical protein